MIQDCSGRDHISLLTIVCNADDRRERHEGFQKSLVNRDVAVDLRLGCHEIG